MFTMNAPRTFRSEVIQTVVYLINRMSSRILSFKSPLEFLTPTTPLFALPLKTFGCIYYVYILKSKRSKLDPKALKCVFLGYSVEQKGYKCYHPPSRQKFVSQDVTFFESHPFFSLQKTFQGELPEGEELSSSIPLPIPVPLYCYDTHDGEKKGNENERHGESSEGKEVDRQGKGSEGQVGKNIGGKELQVYNRRKGQGRPKPSHEPIQESTLDPVIDTCNENSQSPFIQIQEEDPKLDQPIALRKGVQTCTQHPLANFVSYSVLSPSFHRFSIALSSISIPSSVSEAMKQM